MYISKLFTRYVDPFSSQIYQIIINRCIMANTSAIIMAACCTCHLPTVISQLLNNNLFFL